MAVASSELGSLPEAVLLLIIYHLRLASKRNLRLACQRLSQAVSQQCSRLKITKLVDAVQLQRSFPGITELYLSSRLEHAEVIKFVARNHKFLNQLKVLHLPKCCQWGEPDPALFLCFAASCRSLECIMNDCDGGDTSGSSGLLPPYLFWSMGTLCNLRVLDLDSFFSSTMVDGDLHAITGLTRLSDLKLNAEGCSFGLTALRKLACLQRLTICGVHNEHDSGELFEALACLSTLTALTLDFMKDQEDQEDMEDMTEVLQSITLVTQIQQLSLKGDCNIGYEIWEGFRHLCLLKHLYVWRYEDYSWPHELYLPLKALTQVTSLYIYADVEELGWLENHAQLQELGIWFKMEDTVSDILQPLECLTNLRLLQLQLFIVDDQRLANILEPLSALKQLQQFGLQLCGTTDPVTLCDLTALASLPALSKLSFSDPPRLPADDEQQLPSFYSVTELEANSSCTYASDAADSGYEHLGDVELLPLCRIVPNLHMLKLTGMDRRLSPGGFAAALQQLPHLTSLHLSDVNDLPDHAFASICRVTGLEELTLEECENLSLAAVAALLQTPSLRVLRIKKCKGVSKQKLHKLCHRHRREDILPLDW